MAEPTVLVTGAGGFIGGRVVEVLHLSDRARPRAALRRWASAPRIARFGVDMVLCDVLDRRQLNAALEGVDAVVHCAVGGAEENPLAVRTLLTAAREHGVRRVVCLSTAEVYGDAGGEIDETHPCRPVNDYGRSKLEAEDVCRELGASGIEVVILRPSIVYGPFSRWWTERFADRLLSGRWGLYKGYGEGLCNLIYVDDLVGAIWRALTVPVAAGQTFNVNGPERITWNQYVLALNQGLGLPPLSVIDPRRIKLRSLLLAPLRKSAEIGMAHFGLLVFKVYERFGFTRGFLRGAEKSLRTTPAAQELELYSRTGFYLADKAAEVLGWKPRFDLERGVGLSCQWLRHHGFGI